MEDSGAPRTVQTIQFIDGHGSEPAGFAAHRGLVAYESNVLLVERGLQARNSVTAIARHKTGAACVKHAGCGS